MLVYMYSSFPFLLHGGFFDKAPFTNVMEGARINGSIFRILPRASRKNWILLHSPRGFWYALIWTIYNMVEA